MPGNDLLRLINILENVPTTMGRVTQSIAHYVRLVERQVPTAENEAMSYDCPV